MAAINTTVGMPNDALCDAFAALQGTEQWQTFAELLMEYRRELAEQALQGTPEELPITKGKASLCDWFIRFVELPAALAKMDAAEREEERVEKRKKRRRPAHM